MRTLTTPVDNYLSQSVRDATPYSRSVAALVSVSSRRPENVKMSRLALYTERGRCPLGLKIFVLYDKFFCRRGLPLDLKHPLYGGQVDIWRKLEHFRVH